MDLTEWLALGNGLYDASKYKELLKDLQDNAREQIEIVIDELERDDLTECEREALIESHSYHSAAFLVSPKEMKSAILEHNRRKV